MSNKVKNLEEPPAKNSNDGSADGEKLNKRLTLIRTLLLLVGAIFTITTIIMKLINNPMLAKVFSIVSYLVIFSMTLWYYLIKENREKWWREPSIMALCVLTAGYFFWVGTWTKVENVDTASQWCEEYGLKIMSPLDNSNVGESVAVWGTFTKVPLEEEILIINESPDGLGYWPSDPVSIDPVTKTWNGIVYLSGELPVKANILIAKMGKSGGILYDYYLQVANIVKQWVAIEKLTDDIEICDQVTVTRLN